MPPVTEHGTARSLEAATHYLGLLSDPTRVRLLALLERYELSVTELTRATGLPQSRVSTHLARLREGGLVVDRRDGTSAYYRMSPTAEGDSVWMAVRGSVDDGLLAEDARGAERVLAARTGTAAWIDAVAGRMEHHYSPGRTWEATARSLVPLLDLGDVLDVGAGDGVMAELLAHRARSYTCLDVNERMLGAARERLAHRSNVSFVCGDMHELPVGSSHYDCVLMLHVLTYATAPQRALGEAARVLRPNGTLVAATLRKHVHRDLVAAYGHVHDGFEPEALAELATEAGLCVRSCAVTSRERKKPYFEVVTLVAEKRADDADA
ncbi:MAG: methyltransferase domain-containing protein [Deltaproteobacteria bacterium]|nr:MAG: methyltransferase domain-containing protein [Deltaproteobacteria bacterium]